MSISSEIPQIVSLRKCVEQRFGKHLAVHADFVALVAEIEMVLRQHISESTLERVWRYSTRGYATVSLRTLDVLSHYAEGCSWQQFCARLAEDTRCDSEMFDSEVIIASNLKIGDRLRIGWLPDRVCTLRYIGNNRFEAENCENSKLRNGCTLLCPQFALGKPAIMNDLYHNGEHLAKTYIAGQQHGLTILTLIDSNK